MTIDTHVTSMLTVDDIEGKPTDGVYVHGLHVDGARWARDDEAGNMMEPYAVEGTECAGFLQDSMLKELLPPMPVLYVRAVTVRPEWTPTSVGYIRHDDALYDCPVYFTRQRGPTYVFLATLRTQDPAAKWTLAGTALIMDPE